jgi:hypothetical protein
MAARADRAELERRRKRIETLLPLVSQEKRADLQRRLVELNTQLAPARAGFAKPGNLAASAAGVNGIGGLVFQAQAPPGEGRLLKLPFYLYEMDFNQSAFVAPQVGPMVVTSQGANVVDETSPTVIATMPNAADGRRVLSGFKFRTPQISWAKLKVVGLETYQQQAPYGGNEVGATAGTPSPLPNAPIPILLYDVGPGSGATGRYSGVNYYRDTNLFLLLKSLSVGGGANLLAQEGYVDGAIYDARLPEIPGLRGNPDLDSPNRAYIEAALVGSQLTTITFSINLICEVREDTEFGVPIPGPYARPGAQTRLLRDGANVQVSDT